MGKLEPRYAGSGSKMSRIQGKACDDDITFEAEAMSFFILSNVKPWRRAKLHQIRTAMPRYKKRSANLSLNLRLLGATTSIRKYWSAASIRAGFS